MIRCVRAPVDFEDIPLSSTVATDEMFERAITAVKRNGVALKGELSEEFYLKERINEIWIGNLASQNTTNSLNVLLR